MNFLKRAVLLFKIGKNADDKSLRKIAEEVSIPKSSVHRQINSRKKRVKKMGHDFFETRLGIEWLCRLIFGTILIFGIQAGVGSETISLFFQIIFISVYVGTSANSIRKIKNEMRTVISEYGDTQMEEIIKRCKNTELHLGGDESYFSNRLFLVLMEIKSGFILSEELEQNRTFDTWWKCVGGL